MYNPTLQERLDTLFGIGILNNLTNGFDMTSLQGLHSYLVRRMDRNPKERERVYFYTLRLWDPNEKLPAKEVLIRFIVVARETIDAVAFAELIKHKLAKNLCVEFHVEQQRR